MSRQYYDDPYRPAGRRVIIQSRQSPDRSSRGNVPSMSRNVAFPSTFQPNQQRNPSPYYDNHYGGEYSHFNEYPNSTRSTYDRTNNSSNDQSHRRYRLEAPSTHSRTRQPQSYHDANQDVPRSSDRHHSRNQQPSSNYSSASQTSLYDQNYPRHERNLGQNYPRYERNPDQYDRRHHREETYPSTSYPQRSNHRSIDVPSTRQHPNPVRSSDHSSSTSHTHPVRRSSHPPMPMQLHHPASLLSHILQSVFGEHNPSLDNDDDFSPASPLNLIAFAWMMQRPDAHGIPVAFHVHFGDLFDLLAHDEAPSVGLSDTDIERIPTMTYRKTNKSKSNSDKCAICLSEYKTGEKVKYLRCQHFFHPECIDPWLKTSTQCPICRGTQTG